MIVRTPSHERNVVPQWTLRNLYHRAPAHFGDPMCPCRVVIPRPAGGNTSRSRRQQQRSVLDVDGSRACVEGGTRNAGSHNAPEPMHPGAAQAMSGIQRDWGRGWLQAHPGKETGGGHRGSQDSQDGKGEDPLPTEEFATGNDNGVQLLVTEFGHRRRQAGKMPLQLAHHDALAHRCTGEVVTRRQVMSDARRSVEGARPAAHTPPPGPNSSSHTPLTDLAPKMLRPQARSIAFRNDRGRGLVPAG
jgi:hypothetical protein